MSDRSSAVAEVFLWVAVVAICSIGIGTVLADDLFSVGREPTTAQPAAQR